MQGKSNVSINLTKSDFNDTRDAVTCDTRWAQYPLVFFRFRAMPALPT